MDSSAPYAASKDRVLRAVGLNLVNFQRLEKILKWLAELRPITGSVPEINKQLELRRQSTQRSTLGAIIPLWLETAYGQKPQLANPKTDLDVVIAFWLQLNIPAQVLDQHARQLDQLLTERNWFVHTGLAEIDFDSNEACEALLARLGEQNKRVIKQIDFLHSILDRIHELSQFCASDDVQEIIRTEMFGKREPSST
ncbi:MAG TPA: hypothetical protein VJP89_05555 [Pyrinomonadaceae bacterium]|nr:hypothetical protein [Pyrinomonadaceae bacterium]